jgi:hypothetical protein
MGIAFFPQPMDGLTCALQGEDEKEKRARLGGTLNREDSFVSCKSVGAVSAASGGSAAQIQWARLECLP